MRRCASGSPGTGRGVAANGSNGKLRSTLSRRWPRPTAAARGSLERYLAEHPRGKAGQVLYDLKGDFGVDPQELRDRFRFYLDRFDVRGENY